MDYNWKHFLERAFINVRQIHYHLELNNCGIIYQEKLQPLIVSTRCKIVQINITVLKNISTTTQLPFRLQEIVDHVTGTLKI